MQCCFLVVTSILFSFHKSKKLKIVYSFTCSQNFIFRSMLTGGLPKNNTAMCDPEMPSYYPIFCPRILLVDVVF
jgi:hypothetical protein